MIKDSDGHVVQSIQHLTALEKFSLYNYNGDGMELEWQDFTSLPSLQSLHISDCPNLTSLPALTSLQSLRISDCPNLTSLPALTSLQSLDISNCPNLTSLPALTSLQSLRISSCPNLTSLPALTSLQSLRISNCPNLTSLPALTSLQSLKKKIQNKLKQIRNMNLKLGALPKFLGIAVVQQVNSSVVNNYNYLEVRIINC
ncbi:hypothetical protein CMV_000841 [Castanea mollissima]|uniref:R13L1/DRL21-like LRR repeat region domain-containing protein n=1 Tax=Castanea mollissima TaxID=60419 RepID=A0A8J4S566_9ROSI|nr:hypothetical protein CMV_000841 [Castanea mollissima]